MRFNKYTERRCRHLLPMVAVYNYPDQVDQYDRGHGLQEIFGTVWFEDSTWATRGEYDGSEWWEVHEIPEIPDHLKIR